jgi:thiamine kinase-like enzyme
LTRSVLFTASPSPQLYIIDWEFVQLGHRAMDLGQLIGDLLEKSYMLSSIRSQCESMLCSFVKGYGAMSEEMGFRVLIHAGVHILNWCARHPDADLKGKVEALMQRAVEMTVRAWRQERGWFDGDVLGCLFAEVV